MFASIFLYFFFKFLQFFDFCRPVPDESSTTSSTRSGPSNSVLVRKGKSGSAKSVSKKKSDDLWNGKNRRLLSNRVVNYLTVTESSLNLQRETLRWQSRPWIHFYSCHFLLAQ